MSGTESTLLLPKGNNMEPENCKISKTISKRIPQNSSFEGVPLARLCHARTLTKVAPLPVLERLAEVMAAFQDVQLCYDHCTYNLRHHLRTNGIFQKLAGTSNQPKHCNFKMEAIMVRGMEGTHDLPVP